MDEPGPSGRRPRGAPGRLSREAAQSLLMRGDELLAAGEFADAGVHYQRVVGFDDPAITAAALLGLGEARYRLDDEDGAVADVGGRPPARRDAIDLSGLAEPRGRPRPRRATCAARITAYREADRRAPAADKAEIATRLGWLAKETGDAGSARAVLRPRPRRRAADPGLDRSSSPRPRSSRWSSMFTAEGEDAAPASSGWTSRRSRTGSTGGCGPSRCVHARPAPPLLQHVRALPGRARSSSAGTARSGS